MEKPVVRKNWESPRVSIDFAGDPGLTDQSFADSADINVLMRTYERTGDLPRLTENVAQHGDFSEIPDFHTSQLQVRQAEHAFRQLPANIRAEMGHNPQNLLDFVENPANLERAIELGIVEAPEVLVSETPSTPVEIPTAKPVTDPVTPSS